jgi:hypothetical protein
VSLVISTFIVGALLLVTGSYSELSGIGGMQLHMLLAVSQAQRSSLCRSSP